MMLCEMLYSFGRGLRLLTDEAKCDGRHFFVDDVLSSTLNFALCHQSC